MRNQPMVLLRSLCVAVLAEIYQLKAFACGLEFLQEQWSNVLSTALRFNFVIKKKILPIIIQ